MSGSESYNKYFPIGARLASWRIEIDWKETTDKTDWIEYCRVKTV